MACPTLANRWFMHDIDHNCWVFDPVMMQRWVIATLIGVVGVMLLAVGVLIRGVAVKVRSTIVCLFLSTVPMTAVLGHGVYYSTHAYDDPLGAQVFRWIAMMLCIQLAFCSLRECSLLFLDIVVLTGELRNKIHVKLLKYAFDIPIASMFVQMPICLIIIPFGVVHNDQQRELSVRVGTGLVACAVTMMFVLYSVFSWKLVQVMETLVKLQLTKGEALTLLEKKIKFHKLGAGTIGMALIVANALFFLVVGKGCPYPINILLMWGFIFGGSTAIFLLASYKPAPENAEKPPSKTPVSRSSKNRSPRAGDFKVSLQSNEDSWSRQNNN